jgi:hypothetical protein
MSASGPGGDPRPEGAVDAPAEGIYRRIDVRRGCTDWPDRSDQGAVIGIRNLRLEQNPAAVPEV